MNSRPHGVTPSELREIGIASTRGRRIELAHWLTNTLYEGNGMLNELTRQPGGRESWRYRIGSRLLQQLDHRWPPELTDADELQTLVKELKHVLEQGVENAGGSNGRDTGARVQGKE